MKRLRSCGPDKSSAKGDGSHSAQPNRVHGRELFQFNSRHPDQRDAKT